MKIEDLTLKEIKEICDKTEWCPKCRLQNDGCILETVPSEWTTEDMERDIEGVNEE